MGQIDMSIYLKHLKSRYLKANRKFKSQIFNKFCATNGLHRKHVIRLSTRTPIGWRYKPAGRNKHYEEILAQDPLRPA